MNIFNENESDAEIVLKQKVELSDIYNDYEINNEEELIEKFTDSIEAEINRISNNAKEKSEIFGDLAEFVKIISLEDLDLDVITIRITLSRQQSKQKLSECFRDCISDILENVESEEVKFTVPAEDINDKMAGFDPETGREYYEDAEDYEDSEYAYLRVKDAISIEYNKFVGEAQEVRNDTQRLFDEFEYESRYKGQFGRETDEYLHNTYGGNDIKKFDEYIKQNLSFDEMTPEWVDILMKEARKYITESYLNEDIKDGIIKILNKFKDKIDFKYQGNKKNKDGNYYDRFVCKIKKAGIFDLVEFEEKLKELGNQLKVIFKVTYPNDNQDHSYFWIEGRFSNQVVDPETGERFAYESKKLNESEYYDDWKDRNKEKPDQYKEQSKKNGKHKRITMEVFDYYGDIEALLMYIKDIASAGHSFIIDVDKSDEQYHAQFGMDGDGSDRIISIESEDLGDEDKDEEEKTESLNRVNEVLIDKADRYYAGMRNLAKQTKEANPGWDWDKLSLGEQYWAEDETVRTFNEVIRRCKSDIRSNDVMLKIGRMSQEEHDDRNGMINCIIRYCEYRIKVKRSI